MSDVGREPGDVRWRKSPYSADQTSCVEVAELGELVHVRDSKNPDGPVIRLTRAEWRAFVEAVKRGDFDRDEGERDSER